MHAEFMTTKMIFCLECTFAVLAYILEKVAVHLFDVTTKVCCIPGYVAATFALIIQYIPSRKPIFLYVTGEIRIFFAISKIYIILKILDFSKLNINLLYTLTIYIHLNFFLTQL